MTRLNFCPHFHKISTILSTVKTGVVHLCEKLKFAWKIKAFLLKIRRLSTFPQRSTTNTTSLLFILRYSIKGTLNKKSLQFDKKVCQ